MRTVAVLQNSDSEHLGLIEDHLEGRNIRFRYIRPTHDSKWRQNIELPKDGLIILGAAPWGTVSAPVLPQLDANVKVVRSCMESGVPIIAIGTGTQLLALAAEYGVKPTELVFRIEQAHRTDAGALNGFVPEIYPLFTYMRDAPNLPSSAKIIAETEDGTPALYQPFDKCLGFAGHPGIKSAMIEDSVLQSNAPLENCAELFAQTRRLQNEISSALVTLMTGIVHFTGWMNSES